MRETHYQPITAVETRSVHSNINYIAVITRTIQSERMVMFAAFAMAG